MSPKESLERLLSAAFVHGDVSTIEAIIDPAAHVSDAHLAAPTRDAFVEMIQQFAAALDERALTVSAAVGDERRSLCQFDLRARHLGVLWSVVPAGRRIQLGGSASAELAGGRLIALTNSWSTGNALEEFGLRDPEARWIDLYSTEPRSHDAARLVDGAPHRTGWARAWNLSPFLARTAVLVMAGFEATEMAKALGVTTSTARTYVRSVYAATGVHGRIALLQAAKRAGITPAKAR